jgi:Zn-dependent M32 family carboxypeptidase
MVRQLFEIYSEEFKLQQNTTMIQLMLNAKGKGKGLNLAKKKITSITDQRRSAIPQMDKEIVEDLSELEQQDREINNQRNAKQFNLIEALCKESFEFNKDKK